MDVYGTYYAHIAHSLHIFVAQRHCLWTFGTSEVSQAYVRNNIAYGGAK